MRKELVCVLVFCLWNLPLFAAALTPKNVPEPLKPWIPWVLHGQEERYDCPSLYNLENRWQCSWPTRLELNVKEDGGTFRQEWLMFNEGWIALPGSQKQWPQEVKVNGKGASVIDRDGVPAVHVPKGSYIFQGSFRWERLPELIQIAPSTALVSLQLKGQSIAIPDIDAAGRVWLRKRDRDGEGPEGVQESRLEMQVFRRIVDEIPLSQVLHIELDVSGRPREVLLGQGLPAGYIPVSLTSPLPARIDPDGRLRLQVRPGNWTLDLTCRHGGRANEVTFGPAASAWPQEEVWVFDAQSHLRLVEIEGGTPIDPQQTNLPQDWRNLPAYRLTAGETLKMVEKRRGDPDPAPDQLILQRNLWLDFSGKGYTIQDQIHGAMTRGWRLEMLPPATLGQVTVDGAPQFITRQKGSEKTGVEVRRGQIQLVADSRVEKRIRELPAVGWDHDFQQVGATLHLPPGWRLFSATGVDDIPGTWLKKWTLLDLFVVLIIALSISRLWGFSWGVVALVALALFCHESFAPRFVWLHVLFAVALSRVLPESRFRRGVVLYRNGSLIALLLISLPFMVDQVRKGIYPQLERPGEMIRVRAVTVEPVTGAPPAPSEERAELQVEEVPGDLRAKREAYAPKQRLRERPEDKWSLLQYDPKAKLQTGPGLPSWQWTAIPLRWNGPVDRTQTIVLSLIPPWVNMVLSVLRVLLLAALIVCVLGIRRRKGEGIRSSGMAAAGQTALVIGLLGLSLSVPARAEAQFPSQELQDQLRERLLERPDCFPRCADSPKMRLEVSGDRLVIRIEIHALENTAVPLPGSAEQWLPNRVLVNGKPARGLLKTGEGQVWAELPRGLHQILMEGPLPNRASVQVPLPLKQHRLEARVDGWTLERLHEGGLADDPLQLTRIQEGAAEKTSTELETGTLPPFVRIERDLLLGLDWGVQTRVVRISPTGTAIVLEVPLLAGESVTSEGIRVESRKALINMAPEATEVNWSSTFEKKERITLTAPRTISWVEVWRVNVSPIWHAQFSGISVVHHQSQDRWLPEWRPWPEEAVDLDLSRPEGVPGKTLTVDRTEMTVTPGRRATNLQLTATLRSSQGGQHAVKLPEESRLQSVRINDVEQAIRQEGDQVTLPVAPGSQKIELLLQQPRAMTSLFRTPEVDLGVESVNAVTRLDVPRDRWVLLTGGPDLGPAVLFWGVVLIVILIAVVLGRTPYTPLRTHHWFLLGLGLSAAFVITAPVVVAWFFAMGWRKGFGENVHHRTFNLAQAGLGLLTVAAFFSLLFAIQQGLLGYPDMQIAGNGSSAFLLRWYTDRAEPLLPQSWVLTVPMMFYRFLMLAWALWLAFAMLRWSRWVWECFSSNGIWRSGKILRASEGHKPSSSIVPKD